VKLRLVEAGDFGTERGISGDALLLPCLLLGFRVFPILKDGFTLLLARIDGARDTIARRPCPFVADGLDGDNL